MGRTAFLTITVRMSYAHAAAQISASTDWSSVLRQSRSLKKPRNTGLYIMGALAAVFLVIAGFSFMRSLAYSSELKTVQLENTALLQTNKELEKALSDTPKPGAENVVEPSFRYIVREGDSFWTISRKLYGTGSRYKEIAEANNLDVNSVLNVGDELIIK